MATKITDLAYQYWLDLRRDHRADDDKTRNAWLWFICPAAERAAVAVEIANMRAHSYPVELFDGKEVLVCIRSAQQLVCVRAPDEYHVGEQWHGAIDVGDEGPYSLLDGETGHHQRLTLMYLLHPGKSRDDAMRDAGLDDESLIPRY